MKAAFYTRYGSGDVLTVKELPEPNPKKGEVMVKVHATTVNRTDCANLTAKPFIMRFFMGLFRPAKNIPGTDFAGEVVRTGNGVTHLKPGDKVWGFHDAGISTQANYVSIPAKVAISEAPDSLPLHESVACLEGGHYALNFINKVSLQPGQTALVNGGTGAIGSAMIQLLTVRGIRVTATCRGRHKEKVMALGAVRAIDYEKEDFTQLGKTFDYVFDSVGKSTFGKCRRILNVDGIYISSELGPWIQNPFLAMVTPIGGGRTVKFPFPSDVPKTLRYLRELVDKNGFRPLIDRDYPLEEVKEAYNYVLSGQKVGNVILRPGNL